jgi:aryl-alcohol dehydrogenase-like predicted oxidoreductase
VIGATSEAQLKADLAAGDLNLDPAILAEIDKIAAVHPDPCA